MSHIAKLQGVTTGGSFGLPPAADKLLDTVAQALTSDSPSAPSNWMDRGKVAIRTSTQNELLNTMMGLGLYTVSRDAATALIANGHKLPMAEIDAALTKAKVETVDRIKLKAAMDPLRHHQAVTKPQRTSRSIQMGVIEKLKRVGVGGSAPTSPAIVTYDGRERLRAAAGALNEAQACVADLEGQFNRLNAIVSAADAANDALQQAITADGGVALAAYGNGTASNEPIAVLIATKENTARAANAAKTALPRVEDVLAKARAEVVRLEGVKFDALIVFLKTRAADQHAAYVKAYNAMCKSHDALCGIAVALAATGHSEMMTSGAPMAIKAPGFNMGTGPAHGPSESVTMTHAPREGDISGTTADWMKARERLAADPNADIDELIGSSLFQYPADAQL